jgi:hypothetical protein
MKNPFRPTAGATPPEVIGRAGLLDGFSRSLKTPSAPALLITGGRGNGKTVMHDQAQSVARSRSWCVVAETATVGFVNRIVESVRRFPASCGAGLVITVDEIHAADPAEVAQLTATVHRLTSDGLAVRLVVAGLPAAVTDLLKKDSETFLRRAGRIELMRVAVADVERSFARTFAAAGFDATPADVRRAADATAGYPFLIQAVGYFLFREAEAAQGALTADTVDRGITRALQWHAKPVIQSALSAVPAKDMEFLRALAADAGPSAEEDLGRRMGAAAAEVSACRTRLLAAGLIEAVERNRIDFAIPGFRPHLRATRTE